MSYVISIRRPHGKPELSADQIAQRLAVVPGFSRIGESTWAWTLPNGKRGPTLSFAAGELSIEGSLGRNTDASLRTIQGIAASLDAVAYGEEGEELDSVDAPRTAGSPWAALGGAAVGLLMLPFMALVLVVRVPWLVWKLVRSAK